MLPLDRRSFVIHTARNGDGTFPILEGSANLRAILGSRRYKYRFNGYADRSRRLVRLAQRDRTEK
ncbi:hypothetical protein [Burkholderia sp. LA-2-3-30-S1-D2]|uniref:hypothetical protein n=1 Tax=Burkholderia sp. LA-2-3-30-S1-D2 TaxID=1637862 RepID=UPI00075E671F|nr:hypothetical protein [Burkholderia sp. LA-2-3-30-S1-D2]AOI99853.1 hypothetical protein WS66_29510 [Burkholderia sp. LA-2-3-30-S1-D2]KVE10872.1 hypothetical protein WS66_21485 [Burkholderia sp. LA-2-3-30-S1-D2]